jgi:hypothetical protein
MRIELVPVAMVVPGQQEAPDGPGRCGI